MMKFTTNELMIETEDSYSYGRYSRNGWERCIDWLKSVGLTDVNIITFMNSKHMRWAGDLYESGEDCKYGDFDEEALKAYHRRYPNVFLNTYISNMR